MQEHAVWTVTGKEQVSTGRHKGFLELFQMDARNIPSQWHRHVRPQGKVRRRVQDLRIPSSSSLHFQAGRPPLDLSHNEGARLAVDSLLSQGLEGYHAVLKTEGEVDFLSEQEKNYFLKNGKESPVANDADAEEDRDTESESLSSSSGSDTQCASTFKEGDTTEAALGAKQDDNGGPEVNKPNVEVFFNTDKKAVGLKDVVREFIRKAQKSLTVVTDSFSDMELLCDLLEASKKRFVSVHLFLDLLNLNHFKEMWQELKLQGKDFPKFSVHSVEGNTFCTKTSRKLNGQISETFIIADWTEALTGSFSFSWLSWLVHRNLAFLIRGSAVTHFLQEVGRLLCCATPVHGFQDVPFLLPNQRKPHTNTGRSKEKITSSQNNDVHIWDWIKDGLTCHTKERTQTNFLTPQFSRPLRQPVMPHMCMEKFKKASLGGIPTPSKGDVLPKTHKKPQFTNNLFLYSRPPQTDVNQSTTGKNVVLIKGEAHSNSALLGHRQDKTVGPTQNKDFHNRNCSTNHQDYWNHRQSRTIMTPPGIAAGINKLREERITFPFKANPTSTLQTAHHFMSQGKGEKQRVHPPVNDPEETPRGLETTAKFRGIKALMQSPRHHFLRSPSTHISAQPKFECSFLPVTGHKAVQDQKKSSQVKPSPRPLWMPQNIILRQGPTARPVSFYSSDTLQKMDGPRQFHGTSAKPVARSRSMTERPRAHPF